jgi:hypothetical protein
MIPSLEDRIVASWRRTIPKESPIVIVRVTALLPDGGELFHHFPFSKK